jgi:hypothetical protein
MRIIYASPKGGKPMRIGMNYAKRVAHSADQRDQLAVQRELGPSLPRQHSHHQELVHQRHAYYGDVYEEVERERERYEADLVRRAGETIRAFTPEPGDPSASDQAVDDAGGAVSDDAPGPAAD